MGNLLSKFFGGKKIDSFAKGKKIPTFKVNLLVSREQQTKLYIKALKWALSSGRYIVIVVELVVIGAFVVRYKLDTDLLDTQENIKDQAPYLESLKEDEQIIRQTQFKLSTIRQTKLNNPAYAESLLKISQSTPISVKLNNISFTSNSTTGKVSLIISGKTPSNIELSAFIKALKKIPTFADINLTNISFEGQTLFTITGSLVGSGRSS